MNVTPSTGRISGLAGSFSLTTFDIHLKEANLKSRTVFWALLFHPFPFSLAQNNTICRPAQIPHRRMKLAQGCVPKTLCLVLLCGLVSKITAEPQPENPPTPMIFRAPQQQLPNPVPGLIVEFGRSVFVKSGLLVASGRLVQVPGSNEKEYSPVVHLFRQQDKEWKLLHSIPPIPEAKKTDDFGYSLALSQPHSNYTFLLVSSPQTNNAKGSGLVDVFQIAHAHENWAHVERWSPEDLEPGDHFGSSITASGPFVAVGAHWHQEAGAVFLYQFGVDGKETWTLQQKLESDQSRDRFGLSIELSAQSGGYHKTEANSTEYYLAVSAPGRSGGRGSVEIYQYTKELWNQVLVLDAPGSVGLQFGWAIAFQYPWVAVTALQCGIHNVTEAGCVAVYHLQASTLNGQRQDIRPVDILHRPDGPQPVDRFGWDVVLDERKKYLAISAIWADYDDNSNQGMVFVWHLNDTTTKPGKTPAWVPGLAIVEPNGAPLDEFGSSMVISGDELIVGAQGYDDNNIDDGAVFVVNISKKGLESDKPQNQLLITVAVALTGIILVFGSAIISYAVKSKTYGNYQLLDKQLDEFESPEVLDPSDLVIDVDFGDTNDSGPVCASALLEVGVQPVIEL